jgi:hypothetical protein
MQDSRVDLKRLAQVAWLVAVFVVCLVVPMILLWVSVLRGFLPGLWLCPILTWVGLPLIHYLYTRNVTHLVRYGAYQINPRYHAAAAFALFCFGIMFVLIAIEYTLLW